MKKIITISDNWTIGNETYGTVKANVPGDITNDLFRAGKIPDPLFGVNFKKIRWVLESPWEYRVKFLAEGKYLSFPHAGLRFCGIDTFSEVFLNGEKIGETDSMFVPFSFDVKEKLREGENELSVRIKSPYAVYDSRPNEKYPSIFHPNRIFVRKPACTAQSNSSSRTTTTFSKRKLRRIFPAMRVLSRNWTINSNSDRKDIR